jgi:hypothetical protein
MKNLLRDEGVIKYSAIHTNDNPPNHPYLSELDAARTQLYDLGLVGAYPDGIGYGNVSIRHKSGCIISGTATGAERVLGARRYSSVLSFDLHNNIVHTKGLIKASSESMTHCAIYQANSLVQCVLHVHHRELWQKLLQYTNIAIPADIAYGTPQMALSIARLVGAQSKPFGILVMGGLEEGIVAYGQTISLALSQITTVLANQA